MRAEGASPQDRRHPGRGRLTTGERAGIVVGTVVAVAGLALMVRDADETSIDPATAAPTVRGATGGAGAASTTEVASTSPGTADPTADPTAAPTATGDDRVFPGGGTLASYRPEGHESYGWRVNILDHEADLLRGLRALRLDPRTTDLGASMYGHMVSTCTDLRRGVDAQRAAANRWSTTDQPLKARTAGRIVGIVAAVACPGLAPG